MNPAHCPQCGRAVSAVDQAGGSCPWCGRVLTTPYAAKSPTARRSPPAYSPSSSRSSNSSSGWSYWWIPLVALGLLRGVSSCHRTNERNEYKPSYTTPNYQHEFHIPEYDRERVFDAQELLQRIERERREREAGVDLDSDPLESEDDLPNIDEILRRHREALERGDSESDDGESLDGEFSVDGDPVADEPKPPPDDESTDEDATSDPSSTTAPTDTPPPVEE